MFERVFGIPFLATVAPAGTTRAVADSRGRFRVLAGFGGFGGFEANRAGIGTNFPLPGGYSSLRVTFKFSVNFETWAGVTPGPGYASAYVHARCRVTRLRTGSGTGDPFVDIVPPVTDPISHSIAPIGWISASGSQSRSRTVRIPVQLPTPSVAGDVITPLFDVLAEAGGGGPFSWGEARISGTLFLIIIEGLS